MKSAHTSSDVHRSVLERRNSLGVAEKKLDQWGKGEQKTGARTRDSRNLYGN